MELDNWATHKPVIMEILREYPNSKFLELGTGYNSTPFIVNGTTESIHLETNKSWYDEMKKFEKNNHKIEFFENFSLYEWNCDYFNQEWDVCFIDNAPGESRQSNLVKLKDKCKIIICHDTEAPSYGWDFSMFKYVYTYTKYPVTTTLCSNFQNIELFI